jgi:PAT family beta-lactamase induction signal transducer AmpG
MVGFAFVFRLSIGLLEKIGPFFMVDPVAKAGSVCRTRCWA